MLYKDDGSFRGVCFLRFADQAGLDAAVADSGVSFEGRQAWIEKTKPKAEREQQYGNNQRDGRGGFQGGNSRGGSFGNRNGGGYDGNRGGGFGGNQGGDKYHTNQEVTVFVGNLTFNTTEDSVWQAFESVGNIKEVRIAKGPDGSVNYKSNFRAEASLMSSSSTETVLRRHLRCLAPRLTEDQSELTLLLRSLVMETQASVVAEEEAVEEVAVVAVSEATTTTSSNREDKTRCTSFNF